MSRFTLVLIVSYLTGSSLGVRVCETFLQYFNPFSSSCYDNADSERNVTEIVLNWGCTVAEYNVTTADGYRVPIIRASLNKTQTTPIILAHGINTNSNCFVYKYNKTLAYQLLTSGYEIFLLNFRGTRYSSHVNLTTSDKAFWNFSFHEMGIYDLPATLNTIYNITNEKAIYIGHSMGNTAGYVYSSIYPKEAEEKLVGIIALAPVALLTHLKSLVLFIGAYLWPVLKIIADIIGNGQAVPQGNALGAFCAFSPITLFICELTLRAPLFGNDFSYLDPLYYPVQYAINPDAISSELVTHYAQLIRSKKFQLKDYGSSKNLAAYGTSSPPNYNLSDITVPVSLIGGPNDWLTSPENAEAIYAEFNGTVKCGLSFINWTNWNHQDFVTAKNSVTYLNNKVIPLVSSLRAGECEDLST